MSRLQLLVDHDRNRELLASWLDEMYETVAPDGRELSAADLDAADLCLVDEASFARHRQRLVDWKDRTEPVFAPVLLIAEEPPSEELAPSEWEHIDGLYVIDDVVSTPVDKAVLYRRLENLLERRDLSMELQDEYERSEDRFATLFQAMPDPAFVATDGTVTFANDALCSLCETARESVVGAPVGELPGLTEAARGTLEAQLSAAAAGDPVSSETIALETVGGDRRFVETNVEALQQGNHDGVAVVMRDVTERRERERALERSERRFRQIAGRVSEVIWMLSADADELLYLSPSYEELTGRPRDHLGAEPLDDFLEVVHGEDRDEIGTQLAEMLDDVARGEAADDYEFSFRIRRPDGTTRWIEASAHPVIDDGEVVRLVGILDDVSDLKKRQERLRRQNERLEEFAGIVSHDLRNPLQVAKSYLGEFQAANDAPATVEPIQQNLDRMEQLISDLLAVAHDGPTVDDPEPVALAESTTEAWEVVATHGASLEAETDLVLAADGPRLRQLLENLFRNAIDHSDGDVTITVGDLAESDRRGFFVADDGPGIPADERDQVFEDGFTTSESGTGIGLSIVADIVEGHGWDVIVTESEGGGARFEISGVAVAADSNSESEAESSVESEAAED